MYKATSGETTFNIELSKGQFKIDGKPFDLNFAKIGHNRFHVINDFKTYIVEIVKVDKKSKKVEVKVNGTNYPVAIFDKMDLLLTKMGIEVEAEERMEEITAPMPGLILDIAVKEGDQVKAGDKLMVLEAMKMENVIKSPTDATIGQIKVKITESVEFGQSLIRFE